MRRFIIGIIILIMATCITAEARRYTEFIITKTNLTCSTGTTGQVGACQFIAQYTLINVDNGHVFTQFELAFDYYTWSGEVIRVTSNPTDETYVINNYGTGTLCANIEPWQPYGKIKQVVLVRCRIVSASIY
jgi:hypothetical protein